MLLDKIILLYVLLVFILILCIFAIKRIAKVRVWIKTSPRSNTPLVEIGYLQMDDSGAAAEVKLSGSGNKAAIGRVIADSNSQKSQGFVEVITTDINDETEKPHYKGIGFIGFNNAIVDEYGIIYKQVKGNKKKEAIGYTARPSAPHTPTLYGERSWKTLWLVCTLYAYLGSPNPSLDEGGKKKEKKSNESQQKQTEEKQPVETQGKQTEENRVESNKVLQIHADVKSSNEEQKQDNTLGDENTPNLEDLVEQGNAFSEEDSGGDCSGDAEDKEFETESAGSEGEPVTEENSSKQTKVLEVAPKENNSGTNNETEIVPRENYSETTDATDNTSQEENSEATGEAEEASHEGSAEKSDFEDVTKEDKFSSISEAERQRLESAKKTFPKLFASIVRNMVFVDGGTFEMGADPQPNTITDEDGKERGMVEDNESPKHKVTLSAYYINKYPVTQAEWKAVMGTNPSDCTDDVNYPVAPVSWEMAQNFILRLSYITGVEFLLPTEAQWEYAARGGARSKGTAFSGSDVFSEVGHSDHKHTVGQKKANELGLFDMSGLVREWCSDIWGHYSAEEQTDPVGPTEDSPLVVRSTDDRLMRVVRSPSGNETVTNRKGEVPDLAKDFKSYGIRLVCRSLPEDVQEKDKENGANDRNAPVVAPVIKPRDKTQRPAAICHFTGLHSSKKDYLPAEARACAYALLSQGYHKRKYSEYYKDHPYGWRDTALLSSLIFSVLYILLYIVNTGIMGFPLLGNDLLAVGILVAFYYILWAIVRYVKIDCIENTNSFQPKLDLFNKNLGLGCMNWSILFMGAIAIYFTFEYYDYDFIPLIWAIMSGVAVNMTLRGANTRWLISSTYNENDGEDDEDENEVKNPDGDISKEYEWNLDTSKGGLAVNGVITLYFSATEMDDVRQCNPFFAQRKDKKDKEYILGMYEYLKEHKAFMGRVRYIEYQIRQIADKHGLTPVEKMQFALDFVQEPNIKYTENKDCKTINYYDDYIRFPDETLYDKEGDCNSKSLLAAMIFHVMGFNVMYMASRKHQHAAIGIQVKTSDIDAGWYGPKDKLGLFTEADKTYLYCETTGDNFLLGRTLKGVHLDDFEERVLLPLSDEEEEEDTAIEETISRIYNWKLDESFGKELNGNITLNFQKSEIDDLRQLNPFQTYGKNANTYEMNIKSVFSFLAADPVRTKRVDAIAEYIRTRAKEAQLSELETVQFALDFAQAPNITYCIDENSQGIDFAKEYMRFPDEVLFDKEGDCDCKSSLTAALFHSLGYNVIFMLSPEKLKHAAIGIEAKEEWLHEINVDDLDTVLREYNGKRYLYCETTGDNFTVGKIKEGDSIQDFESIVEIPV